MTIMTLRASGRVTMLAFALTSASALAAVPLPDANIQAQRAIVGDLERGIGPGAPGELWVRLPDDPAPMASTTKSFSMHLVTRAVGDGTISMGDAAAFSANALIPRCDGHSSLPGPSTPAPGDALIISDQLLGSMIPSGSDSTNAMGEYLASVLDPSLVGGAAREAAFVQLMNDRATEMGLVNTQFFNPYGGDHLHDAGPCASGTSVAHQTTAREMARWFSIAMDEDPVFRGVVGFRGSPILTTTDNLKTFALGTWDPSYPGMLGQKGGSNNSCASCLIGQASRIGRELVVSYLQSVASSSDGTELLDYGYAVTFEPQVLGASPTWKTAKDHAVAVVGGTRAVVAALTASDKIELGAWAVDASAPSIQKIANGFSGPCSPQDLQVRGQKPGVGFGASITGVTQRSPSGGREQEGDGRAGSGPGSSGGTELASPWKPLALDLVHLGQGVLVLAVENVQGIALSTWGLPACGRPFVLDSAPAAKGRDVKLVSLRDGLFAVVSRTPGGAIRVETWSADLGDGELSATALDDIETTAATKHVVAAQPFGLDGSHLMLGLTTDGGLRLEGFSIDGFGQIETEDFRLLGAGSALEVATVTGFAPDRHVYVAARRGAGNRLRLNAFTWDGFDTIPVGADDGTVFAMDEDGQIAMASYVERGILVAVKQDADDTSSRLGVWSLDDDPLSVASPLDVNFMVEAPGSAGVGAPSIVRLPTGQAEGDFIVVHGDALAAGSPLRLDLVRSGER